MNTQDTQEERNADELAEARQRIKDLEAELAAREGLVCDQCIDGLGWRYNAVEDRYPCTCMTEAEPYQLLQHDLAASQAREYVLRKALQDIRSHATPTGCRLASKALSTPSDDTALREYGAKLLEEMAVELGVCEHKCDVEVHNKAAELRSGK